MTLVKPDYKPTSGRRTIDGVLFLSYKTGILKYAQISQGGQILTASNGHHRSTYHAVVLGYGILKGKSGRATRFHTQEAAARAAIKKLREISL